MTVPVKIGNCTLYLGDCREILPTLRGFDAVITDPPFEAEAHTQQRRKLGRVADIGREVVSDALPFAAIDSALRDDVCREVARCCSGWALYFCQAEAVALWRDAAERAGQKYKRAMVWIKPDGMPQFSGDRPGMGYESIVSAWCGSGRSAWNGGGRLGVFTFNKNDGSGPAPHPTTKPRALMAELVRLFSLSGGAVLDPFMGSGTTGVSCVQLGRKFTGIELDPRYFDIACERIEKAYSQGVLFSPDAAKAEQIGMDI